MTKSTIIRTRRGVEIMIDAGSLPIVEGRSVWLLNKGGYPLIWMDGKRQLLHRVITKAPNGMEVDHINGNVLDCRLSNLRVCSRGENLRNRGAYKNNSSGRKGVSWSPWANKWRAEIRLDRKGIHIGYFTCLEAAADAYDKAALELHGDFARTNKQALGMLPLFDGPDDD